MPPETAAVSGPSAFVRRAHALGQSGAMSCLEAGDPRNQKLVFSHANGFNGATYRTLLAPLAATFHVIACDLRGHGATTLPADEGLAKGWSVFADDLIALLAGMGSSPAILSGHSLGATASLFAAAKAPDRIAALVLAEPVLLPPPVDARHVTNNSLAQMAAQRRDTFPSAEAAFDYYRNRGIFTHLPDAVFADYIAGGVAGPEGAVRLSCAPAWESEIFRDAPLGIAGVARHVACPLTILRGSFASTAVEQQVAIVRQVKAATRVITIEGATHFLPIEKPEYVREEIRRVAGV